MDFLHLKRFTYTATTGSTSHGSGTSRFIVRVREGGMLEKKAKGPAVKLPSEVKESCTMQKMIISEK